VAHILGCGLEASQRGLQRDSVDEMSMRPRQRLCQKLSNFKKVPAIKRWLDQQHSQRRNLCSSPAASTPEEPKPEQRILRETVRVRGRLRAQIAAWTFLTPEQLAERLQVGVSWVYEKSRSRGSHRVPMAAEWNRRVGCKSQSGKLVQQRK
jgi:hypothetical protein